ncbi:MAG: flagellar biosynthetic protein FliO [Eubacteriales bacterium]|nr:flagellar biosynthetic protein FliO [Eubacteriales bacterium]MDD4629391.1 flagellar biosynthetic protein FliO [Eubacteriales bacterium]
MIGDIFSLVFALIAMICIILLTYYVSRWYGRKMGPIAGGKHIKAVDRMAVSKTGSLLIVDISGKQYLIGVSDQNVQILTELPELIPLPPANGPRQGGMKDLVNGSTFKSMFNSIKKQRSGD